MQKILEISADQFLKAGITTNQYSTSGGLFWRGPGIDPFQIPGLLLGGLSGTDTGTGIIAEPINQFVQTVGSQNYINLYGNSGGFYRLNSATDVVTSLRSVSASSGQGLSLFKSAVYYTRNSTIGKMTDIEFAAPTFSDDYKQLSNSISDHPVHSFEGTQYVGDKNVLTSDDGTNYTEAALTLPSDHTIVDIDDDGYYLILGTNIKAGSNLLKQLSFIFFWDTVSPNWNFQWQIPEGQLTAINKFGEGKDLVAFTGSGLYKFSYASAPDIIIPGSSASGSPFGISDLQPTTGGTGFWKGLLAWASNGRLWTYGKVLTQSPKTFFTPISLTSIKAFYVDGFSRIYASDAVSPDSDSNLWKLSGGNTNPTLETRVIEFPQPMHIKAIKLFVEDLLTGTKSVQVQITGDNLGVATVDTTFDSTATGASTNRSFWRYVQNLKANKIRILIVINNGITFRKIELFGDPITDNFVA